MPWPHSGRATPALRDATAQVSMAETKCARWRVKSVPVWLIEKGCESPGLFSSVACVKAPGA